MNAPILSRVFTFCLLIFLVSCGTIRNEYWINGDGSGRSEMYIDMSEMLGMMEMMSAFSESDSTKTKKKSKDPIAMALENGETFDTTLNMFTMVRDTVSGLSTRDSLALKLNDDNLSLDEKNSIKQALKFMDSTDIRMVVDKAASKMEIYILSRYDDINEIYSIQEALKYLSDSGDKQNPMSSGFNQGSPFKGASFDLGKKTLVLKTGKPSGEKEEDTESLEQAHQMGFDMNIDYIIHLPGKIKKHTGEGVSVENNTARFNLSMEEMMNPDRNDKYTFKFKPSKKKKK